MYRAHVNGGTALPLLRPHHRHPWPLLPTTSASYASTAIAFTADRRSSTTQLKRRQHRLCSTAISPIFYPGGSWPPLLAAATVHATHPVGPLTAINFLATQITQRTRCFTTPLTHTHASSCSLSSSGGEMRRQIPPVSRLVHLAAAVTLLAAVAASASQAGPAVAVNVTAVLSAFPDLADFTRLLASTPVLAELAGRSSLTLLAVPNRNLPQSPLAFAAASGADLADVLRYHVLLEYLSPADLRRLPASGKLVTTLFQTTGRAPADLGAVNVTTASASGATTLAVVRSPAPSPGSNATVLGAITAVPYNLSVLAVSGLIVPSGFDLAASESRPPPAVNITRVLADARAFNVAASMLEASGVAGEFEADERGAGITVFAPTDDAFAGLPAGDRLQSLPAERKAVVLRFHVLHSYYPLGSLESIVNPVQPTLATEFSNAGRFTLNITRSNGSVAIDTGVVQATITRTVFDQNPVAVFAVSKVLLPKEMFTRIDGGESSIVAAATGAASSPPPAATAPEASDSARTPPTKLSSPPALRGGGGGEDYDTASARRATALATGERWWWVAGSELADWGVGVVGTRPSGARHSIAFCSRRVASPDVRYAFPPALAPACLLLVAPRHEFRLQGSPCAAQAQEKSQARWNLAVILPEIPMQVEIVPNNGQGRMVHSPPRAMCPQPSESEQWIRADENSC
ncbi:hypothetical protein HU200_031936 [Digitaria exilis]|uniref:FAS1 domain-containing protein n=1 Tax=Digitaria exilis TaxID=1010633 RepID=A0A835BPN4_9POAL|nr:hypothetical protein HU200_031936 [Digitaria exilis]